MKFHISVSAPSACIRITPEQSFSLLNLVIASDTASSSIADVAAGAGISTPFTIDNAFSEQEFPADEIPTGADCGVPINGDSMEPEYPNGCIVWVKQNADVKFGDCIIAVINGEPFFKIYKPDGLHSYNANYKPIIVNDSDQFEIFGKVIGYYSE